MAEERKDNLHPAGLLRLLRALFPRKPKGHIEPPAPWPITPRVIHRDPLNLHTR